MGISGKSLGATADDWGKRRPQGPGVAAGESPEAFRRPSLETISVLLSHLACIYMVPEKGFLLLNYACGFAPLFYQNQTKCYSTTLHINLMIQRD